MNLRALQTLIEIERVGSFAAAASRLGLTLSAVSLQMKTLENELQLALFDRAHRPPSLTPAGRRVVRHARAMVSEANAIRAVGTGDDDLHGDYRLGFVATASVRLMPTFLAAARRRHPQARMLVEIGLSSDLIGRLRDGAIDAAVVTGTADLSPDLAFRRIATEAFAIAAPRAAMTDGGPPTLARCAAALPFVQFAPSTGIGLLVAERMRAESAAPSDVLVLDSVEAVMGCVSAGVGFAVLPAPDVARYAGPDVAVAPAPGLSRELGLATPKTSPMAERLLALTPLFEVDDAASALDGGASAP